MRTVFFVLLVAATTASAADTRWGLRWKAPDECVSPSELSALVEKKLGRAVFGADPDYRIEGVMTGQAAAPRWKARVTVVSAQGDVLGSREVAGDGDCRSLDERVAFIVSVSIEENVTGAPKPEVVKPAPPPAVVTNKAPPPKRTPGSVWVEIDADTPRVTLMRIAAQAFGRVQGTNVHLTTYEKSCVAPCEAFVDSPSSDFYLSGPGMTNTALFSLAQYEDGVRIKVKSGSLAARAAGVLLTTVGLASAIAGGLFALIGGLSSPMQPGVQNPYGGVGSTFQTIGWGMLIGGGAGLAAGIPLIAFSGTKLEFLPVPAPQGGVGVGNPNVTEL